MLSLLVYMLVMADYALHCSVYSSGGFILLFVVELVFLLADVLLLLAEQKGFRSALNFRCRPPKRGRRCAGIDRK